MAGSWTIRLSVIPRIPTALVQDRILPLFNKVNCLATMFKLPQLLMGLMFLMCPQHMISVSVSTDTTPVSPIESSALPSQSWLPVCPHVSPHISPPVSFPVCPPVCPPMSPPVHPAVCLVNAHSLANKLSKYQSLVYAFDCYVFVSLKLGFLRKFLTVRFSLQVMFCIVVTDPPVVEEYWLQFINHYPCSTLIPSPSDLEVVVVKLVICWVHVSPDSAFLCVSFLVNYVTEIVSFFYQVCHCWWFQFSRCRLVFFIRVFFLI